MNWVRNHPDRIFRSAQCTDQMVLFDRVEEPLESGSKSVLF
jgi:hypothetical protein